MRVNRYFSYMTKKTYSSPKLLLFSLIRWLSGFTGYKKSETTIDWKMNAGLLFFLFYDPNFDDYLRFNCN